MRQSLTREKRDQTGVRKAVNKGNVVRHKVDKLAHSELQKRSQHTKKKGGGGEREENVVADPPAGGKYSSRTESKPG